MEAGSPTHRATAARLVIASAHGPRGVEPCVGPAGDLLDALRDAGHDPDLA